MSTETAQSAAAAPPAKILICDDDPTVRLLARECLEAASFEVVEAADGEQALTAYQQHHPDLVYLDVDMPKVDGFSVCLRIRESRAGRDVPILIATGADDNSSIDRGFEVGATQYKTKPINWMLLPRDIRYMLRAARAFNVLKAQQAQLVQLAYFDPLTGLPNRRSFTERMKNSLKEVKTLNRRVGLLMIDLDNFKRIHDPLGEVLSNRLLTIIADRLLEGLAEIAPPGPDVTDYPDIKELSTLTIDLIRPGGDEFNVVVRNAPDQETICAIAQKILNLLIEPLTFANNKLVVTASIGIARAPEDGDTPETLVRRAASALEAAKAGGRNRYHFYEAALDDDARRKLKLEADLRAALDSDNQLFMAYQPQIDTETGKIAGMEALARWNHPEWGAVSPGVFAPLAEESGLINQLGDWIFQRIERDFSEQPTHVFKELTVSINLSPLQFTQADFTEALKHNLKRLQTITQVELELTEGVIMSDTADSLLKLTELREAGITLAIDDFGTGYSSLSYLKDFPVQTLKIDRSFVNNLSSDSGQSIVRAILAVANAINLTVVAEGVETRQQAHFLTRQQCQLLQGFWLAQPMALSEVVNLLDDDFRPRLQELT